MSQSAEAHRGGRRERLDLARGGTCTIAGNGLTNGEPVMALN